MSKIYEKDALLLRVHVGHVTDNETDEEAFELSLSIGTQSPMVKCIKTGRTFSLHWEDILEIATKAGITQEPDDG